MDETHFEDGQFAFNVEEIAKEWDRSRNETHISKDMWEQFIHANWDLELNFKSAHSVYLRENVRSSRKEIQLMSNYIPQTICDAPLNRVLYQGGPGTGKTLVLIEQAKKMSKEFDHVMVVCYNEPLRDVLRESLKGYNCLVMGVLELAQSVLASVGITLEMQNEELATLNYEEKREWWGGLSQRALECVEKDFGLCGAIIVDEAQDFQNENWWELLSKFHSNPKNGNWFVAWDPDQRIYDTNAESSIEVMRSWMPEGLKEWELGINFRNSAEIHAELQKEKESKDVYQKYEALCLFTVKKDQLGPIKKPDFLNSLKRPHINRSDFKRNSRELKKQVNKLNLIDNEIVQALCLFAKERYNIPVSYNDSRELKLPPKITIEEIVENRERLLETPRINHLKCYILRLTLKYALRNDWKHLIQLFECLVFQMSQLENTIKQYQQDFHLGANLFFMLTLDFNKGR